VTSKTLFDSTFPLLERTLNVCARNQKLTTSNLANLDTPNFKAFKMMVDEAVANDSQGAAPVAMVRTQAAHLAGSAGGSDPGRPPERIEADPASLRGDGNTVDLDREMTNLAANTLRYNAGVRMLSSRFKHLLSAINEGK
jgi:flagellar basal-body rod protein FlgB